MKRDTVVKNLIWRLGERFGAKMVQFIVQMILAKMLAPEIWGTIGLILIFIEILQVFIESGLGNALIQKKDADDLDFSTVFYSTYDEENIQASKRQMPYPRKRSLIISPASLIQCSTMCSIRLHGSCSGKPEFSPLLIT